jgi:hypothetical protein
VYNLATRLVLGRLDLASSMVVTRRRREFLLRFVSGGLVEIDDGVLGGVEVGGRCCSCSIGGGCGRPILAATMARWEFILFLLIFSVDGGGCFFGCVSGKLWSLVSFAFGGRSMFPCCALASGRQTLHRRRPISFRAMVAEVILLLQPWRRGCRYLFKVLHSSWIWSWGVGSCVIFHALELVVRDG